MHLSKHAESPLRQPSLTDIWSAMVGYHFIKGTTRTNFYTNESSHGDDFYWSDAPNLPAYQSRQIPFPIIAVATQTPGNDSDASLNERMVYEVHAFLF